MSDDERVAMSRVVLEDSCDDEHANVSPSNDVRAVSPDATCPVEGQDGAAGVHSSDAP